MFEFSLAAHNAHAAPAAAHGGFYDHRIADLGRESARFGCGAYRFFRPGKHRYASRIRQPPSRRFVSEEFEQFGGRSNKGDASLLARASKFRILGQETVAGMNGVDALFLSQCNDAGNVEIGFDRTLARSDLVSLVRLEPVQSQTVFLRIDSDGAQA